MSSTKKFFKSSMVYFMGNVLTKIISFFLLPLYTTRISTDEYGYFNTSTNGKAPAYSGPMKNENTTLTTGSKSARVSVKKR